MKKTAQGIRDAIKAAGFNRNDVSVKCDKDYTIYIRNVSFEMDYAQLLQIVGDIYYQKSHAWLIVFVDNYCLPFDKPTAEARSATIQR